MKWIVFLHTNLKSRPTFASAAKIYGISFFQFIFNFLVIICCTGCRADILMFFQNLDANILRSYVSRQEGVLFGLLVGDLDSYSSITLRHPLSAAYVAKLCVATWCVRVKFILLQLERSKIWSSAILWWVFATHCEGKSIVCIVHVAVKWNWKWSN